MNWSNYTCDGQMDIFDFLQEKSFEEQKEDLEERMQVVRLQNPVVAFDGPAMIKTRDGCLIDNLFLAKVHACCLFESHMKEPCSNAGFGVYRKEDIGEYEVLEEKAKLIPRYAKSSEDLIHDRETFTHYVVDFI